MCAERPVVLIGLGSNIDAESNLPRAAKMLAESLEVIAASPVFESAPVEAPGTPEFLNAVIRVETALGPRSLKFGVLRAVERRLGRVRIADRNAPRTIDLDLVLHGDRVASDCDLILPDPDLDRFAHLYVPAAAVAPEACHPRTGETMREIADRLRSDLRVRDDVRLG